MSLFSLDFCIKIRFVFTLFFLSKKIIINRIIAISKLTIQGINKLIMNINEGRIFSLTISLDIKLLLLKDISTIYSPELDLFKLIFDDCMD